MGEFEVNVAFKAEQLGIDLRKISVEVERDFQDALGGIADATRAHIFRLANERFKDSIALLNYKKAVKRDDPAPNVYIISLVGNWANRQEDGTERWDMKPGLLYGPKSKATADGLGRYNTIPFQKRLKGKAAEMRNLGDALMQRQLGDALKARGLDKIILDKEGRPAQGIVARLKGPDLHANLQGVVKVQKTYNKVTQSQFFVFRRVSTKTPASKWWYPQKDGMNIFRDVEKILDQQIDNIMRKILGGGS